jgi:hypothetical protein
MPALTTVSLRNFKGNFRAAVASIMDARGWSDAHLENSSATLSRRARREITFELGEAINLHTLESGRQVYDAFNYRLRIAIVTGRRPAESFPAAEARALHESMVADTLDLFAEDAAPFTPANLPYYSVKTILPAGTRSDFDPIYFEDRTDIDFAGQFCIRSDAWPAGM